jgi:anti-sigma factor RsiW
MECKEAVSLMHEYLDGDLSQGGLQLLNRHLTQCTDCRSHYKQLESTDASMHLLLHESPPADLAGRIMRAVPQPKKQPTWLDWIKRHPAVSVAAVFFLVMFGSITALWNQDTELMVKGSDLEQIVIQGNKVIVPAGTTLKGNLVVENGQIQVDGQVDGNLVVIDGTVNLASTAYIAGEVTSINQAIDWIWYKISELLDQIS